MHGENIELDFITKDNISKIWEYLNKKGALTFKIFYLHYTLGVTLKEISENLEMNENSVKTILYRTIKEIKKNFGKRGEENE